MPFVKKTEVENGLLGIWELTESTDTLIAGFQFSEDEKKEFEKFSFQKRQAEYLAIRLLLQNLLGEKKEITYRKSGRPQIKNSSLNISISHSAELVFIFVSPHNIGVDVEKDNRKIETVAKRFLHQNELNWIEKSENPRFLKILLWCAKEAVFKCTENEGIQFDQQIFVPFFDYRETETFRAELTTQKIVEHFNLWYFYFKNNIFVYCVEVKNNHK